MDLGSLNFSESDRRRGAQLLLIRFATNRLHEICNGSIDGIEDGGGGGTHSSPTALGLGISAPPQHTPNFLFFVLDWEGAQKCFILRDQTTGDLKSHHLQARVTLKALSVPPRPHFLSADLFCHISYLAQLCITVYTRNIIYIYNA